MVLCVQGVHRGDISEICGGKYCQTCKISIFIKIPMISFIFPSYPTDFTDGDIRDMKGMKGNPWDFAEKSRFCKIESTFHHRFHLYHSYGIPGHVGTAGSRLKSRLVESNLLR